MYVMTVVPQILVLGRTVSADDECRFCKRCLNTNQEDVLMAAQKEHQNRRSFRRIFPRTYLSSEEAKEWDYLSDESFTSLNRVNKMMTLWFKAKCEYDVAFCR